MENLKHSPPQCAPHSSHSSRVSSIFSSETLIFAALLLASVLLRLPFFFQDLIDRDESVFILMGQSIIDGHLPYTQLWDNKPPVGYLVFAITQYLFPDNLAAIRLAGALLVTLASFLTYRLARTIMPRQAALLAGLLCCFSVSLIASSGQAVMMEHVANPLVLLAVIVGTRKNPSFRDAALFGVLLALAIFVRTNLSFAALILAVFWVLLQLAGGIRTAVKAAVGAMLGGMSVVSLVSLPFLLAAKMDLLFTSLIKVSLSYSAYGPGYLVSAHRMFKRLLPASWDTLPTLHEVSELFFWSIGLLGLVLIAFSIRSRKEDRASRTIIIVSATAVLVATLANGHSFGHYLIQLMPFIAIGVAYTMTFVKIGSGWRSLPLFALIIIVSGKLVLPAYVNVADLYSSKKRLYSGTNFALAEYLHPVMKDDDTIFVSQHILLYWLLKKIPVVPIATSPFNIFREKQMLKPLYGEAFTTELLLKEILDRRPNFLVLTQSDSPYVRIPSFTERVRSEYVLTNQMNDVLIYQLRAN